MLLVELEEERDEDATEAEEGKIDPKDPAPAHTLGEATTLKTVSSSPAYPMTVTYLARDQQRCQGTTWLRKS
jgi:hypothetical protein